MTHLVALLLTTLGFAALCHAMPRHQQDLLGRRLSARAARLARLGGFAGLALALAIDMAGLGPAYGAIAWIGHLSFGAALTVTRLCWRARRQPAPAARAGRRLSPSSVAPGGDPV